MIIDHFEVSLDPQEYIMSGEKLSDLLAVFHAVVEAGSFSAAGRDLNMTPAWVAKQVTRLEAYLGAALLLRSTRSLRLTEAGQDCYRTAGRVAGELETLREKLHADSQLVSGVVRVNVPSIIAVDVLAPHIATFQKLYPNLRLDVVVSEAFVDVLNADTDILIRVVHAMSDSSIIVQKTAELSRVLCASKAYLGDHPSISSIRDLAGHKGLMFGGANSPKSWRLRHGGAVHDFAPEIVVQANNSFVLRRAAMEGAGLAFLPSVIVEEDLRRGDLQHLAQFEDAEPFKIFLLRAPQKHLPRRIRLSWDFLSDVLKSADLGGSFAPPEPT
jgi:DNA-binding transcriptional LysR family regulator